MIPTPILNIIFRQVNFSKKIYLTSVMLKLKAAINLSSLFFYILIIFSLDSISATGNKNLCTESSGIWRIFNHTCYDNCSKKIDKNTPFQFTYTLSRIIQIRNRLLKVYIYNLIIKIRTNIPRINSSKEIPLVFEIIIVRILVRKSHQSLR